MAKQPAIQFYVGDWRKDVGIQSLSYEERGVWFEMLLLMFESKVRGKLCFEEGVPMPEEALARALGIDKQKCNHIVRKLIQYGVAKVESDTGVIYNKRMVDDARLAEIRAECGRLGGNPNLLNQNKSKTQPKRKQNATPSTSTSSSNKENHIKENLFVESAERIWQVYPKKDGKKKGIEAIVNALKRGCTEDFLIGRVKLYAESRSVKEGFCMNAQGWFNQERYHDESLDNPQPNGNQISIEQVKAEYEQVYYEDLHADISEYRAERQAFLNADERTILTKYRDEYESMCRRIRNRQR